MVGSGVGGRLSGTGRVEFVVLGRVIVHRESLARVVHHRAEALRHRVLLLTEDAVQHQYDDDDEQDEQQQPCSSTKLRRPRNRRMWQAR